jgi:outer membrane cobalamin receptor
MRLKETIWIFCFLSASAVHAQGIQDSVFHIRGVNVSAERIFEKELAGMKTTEIDSVILQEKATVSLSDLLSGNTSVFIKNYGRGALATASFRGTAASHTQVNWNGININSPMVGMVDFSLIPVYLIDDLNLKHGSASMSDRGGGIGGSINIINNVKWSEKTDLKYIQGMGSFRTFDEFLQLGVGNKKIRLKTRLYHSFSKNDYTFVNRGIGNLDPETGILWHPLDTNDNAAYSKFGILQEVYYRPRSNQVLSLKYWGQFADRTIPRPTSYEGPENSNLNNQQDADHKVVADWNYYGSHGKLLLRSGYARKLLDYTQKNQVPGLGLVPAIYSESLQRSFLNTLSYSYDLNQGFSFETAADINLHDVFSQDSIRKKGYEKQRIELSMFVALHKSFADRLNLNLMIRQDWIDRERVPLSPFLGFDFRIIDGVDLLLKGNISSNYHQPSLNDLYWQPGGNPDLLPEEGFSVEAGLEYQLLFSGNQLKTELTVYRSDIDHWIIWIPSYKGYWEPRNISRVLSKGLEYSMSLQGNLHQIHYKLAGTYTYTSSVNYGDPLVWGDDSYGKQLVYIPLHSGNFFVNLSYKKFFITYQYTAYSERFTTSSNDLTRRDWLYPHFMNDASAGREFQLKKIAFSAQIKLYNLLNESYHSILFRPMPGRHFNLVLMMKI